MKKILALVLVLILFISLVGCNKLNLTEINDKQYLILPVSEQKIYIWDHYKEYLRKIDLDLLRAAEEKLIAETSQYTDDPHFALTVDDDGFLCLYVEVIIHFDPPATAESSEAGYEHDHEHKFFRERITKP